MGTFQVAVAIGDPEGENWVDLDALVDTGASITAVPSSFLRQLGVAPQMQKRFRFGQGEVRTMDVGRTWLRVEGEEIFTQVLFNEEGTIPLLGALALEDAYLGVDPIAQTLVPVDGLMM
jgi:clan AA aspartic protease